MGARGKVSAYTVRIPLRVTRAMDFELKLLAALERVSVADLIRRMIADSLRSQKPGRSRHAKKFAQAREALDEMWRMAEAGTPEEDDAPKRTWPPEYETEEDWLAEKKRKKKVKKEVKKAIKERDDAQTS